MAKSLNKELDGCLKHLCEGDSEPPVTSPVTGESVCAPGTSYCSDLVCCFGKDNCCACAATGGFVCCDFQIGCSCC